MKKINNERGQSLVELAISIFILVYLLAGAVEFGMAFFQFVQLRDAALYGSMNPTNLSGIEDRARSSSDKPINLDPSASNPATVQIYVDGTLVQENYTPMGIPVNACEGYGLQVRVSFDHQIFMPFIPQFIGSSTIPLDASVTDTILSPIC